MIDMFDSEDDMSIHMPGIVITPTKDGLWVIERFGRHEQHAYDSKEAALIAANKPGPHVASIARRTNKTVLSKEDFHVPAKPDSPKRQDSNEGPWHND